MSTIVKKIISTSLCPRPVGPYNQAVIIDRTVYLSGVVGLDKDTGKLVPGGVVPETVKALQNIKDLLSVTGSHIDNVIKCTVLLRDINDFSDVNREYTKGSLNSVSLAQFVSCSISVFTSNYPARTCYQAGALPIGAAVEIEVIAIVGDVRVEIVTDDSKL